MKTRKEVIPLNDHLIIEVLPPTEKVSEGGIIELGDDRPYSHGTVLDSSCSDLLMDGDYVFMKKMSLEKRSKLGIGDNRYLVKKDRVLAKSSDGMLNPLGQTIAIKRDIDETQSEGGLIIPAMIFSRDQSLTGFVTNFGMGGDWSNCRMALGDKVQLAAWDQDIVEVDTMEGYYLFCKEKHISHIIHED